MKDIIYRQAAIDAVADYIHNVDKVMGTGKLTIDDCKDAATSVLDELPSAQPTLYGYDIRHLELIAAVLQEENLPPERVTEALTDIGRIVEIVANEFEEQIRKAFKL